MKLDDQREVLRPFCTRFERIALINLYLAGAEFDFTEMVVRLASERGPRCDAACVDLHLEADNIGDAARVEEGLRFRLGEASSGCRQVTATF